MSCVNVKPLRGLVQLLSVHRPVFTSWNYIHLFKTFIVTGLIDQDEMIVPDT